MGSIMDIIATETNGKSYRTFKYSFDGKDVPSFDYEDYKQITWDKYGETIPPKGSVSLKIKQTKLKEIDAYLLFS